MVGSQLDQNQEPVRLDNIEKIADPVSEAQLARERVQIIYDKFLAQLEELVTAPTSIIPWDPELHELVKAGDQIEENGILLYLLYESGAPIFAGNKELFQELRSLVFETEAKEPGVMVIPPMGDKNWMIAFDGRDNTETWAYNSAIQEIMAEAELNPFHQVGSNMKTGFQAWEAWCAVEFETVEAMRSEIEVSAREKIGLFSS